MRFIYLAAMRDHMITWSCDRALLSKMIILLPAWLPVRIRFELFSFVPEHSDGCMVTLVIFLLSYLSMYSHFFAASSVWRWMKFSIWLFRFYFLITWAVCFIITLRAVYFLCLILYLSLLLFSFKRGPLNKDRPPRCIPWKKKTGCSAYFKFKRKDLNGGKRTSRSSAAKQRGRVKFVTRPWSKTSGRCGRMHATNQSINHRSTVSKRNFYQENSPAASS